MRQQLGFSWSSAGPTILTMFGLVLELSVFFQEMVNMGFCMFSLTPKQCHSRGHGTNGLWVVGNEKDATALRDWFVQALSHGMH